MELSLIEKPKLGVSNEHVSLPSHKPNEHDSWLSPDGSVDLDRQANNHDEKSGKKMYNEGHQLKQRFWEFSAHWNHL